MGSNKSRNLKTVFTLALCLCLLAGFFSGNLALAQDKAKAKPKISLFNLGQAGLMQPAPGGFNWLPDGKHIIYNERGTFFKFEIETGKKEKFFSPVEVERGLMKDRKARKQSVMNNTNATGRFDRSADVFSNDYTKFLGFTDNDIYIYDIATKEAKFLTNDAADEIFQTISPDNKKIAYVKGNDIYMMTIADGKVTRLTNNGGNDEIWNGVPDWVYEEELTIRRAFWWSPDSEKIAYLQFDTRPIDTYYIIDHLQLKPDPELQKFPLAGSPNSIVKLGVVDLQGKTRWIDTGENTDVYIFNVKWTTSGKEFAYHWMNRQQNRLELRFADPATGKSRVGVVETSESWVNASGATLTPFTNLMFLKDDSFLWGSERTGFRHIYHYAKDGTLKATLTKGEWPVDDIHALDTKEQVVYFSGRDQGPLDTHLYQVNLDGTGFKRITKEPGTHNSNVSPDGKYAIINHTTIKSPADVKMFKTSGELVHTFKEADTSRFARFNFNLSELGSIKSRDGETLYTMTTLPPDFDKTKKYPVIVYSYGGPGVQLVTNSWSPMSIIYHQLFAAKGYIVFTLDNRGSYGRGLAFESKIYRNLGTLEWMDQVDGVNYLKTLPYVDGNRVGIIGGSYGGSMVLYGLLRAPETFHVGVSMYPGIDWRHYDTIYTERYMGTPQDNPKGYANADLSKYAGNLKGKLYLYAGMMDNNVHVQQITQMVDALIKAQKNFKFMLYPQERHGVADQMRMLHSLKTTFDFFEENLMNKK